MKITNEIIVVSVMIVVLIIIWILFLVTNPNIEKLENTPQYTDLIDKVVLFFNRTTNKNYIEYVTMLADNQNIYANLGSINTYNTLSKLGSRITTDDVYMYMN